MNNPFARGEPVPSSWDMYQQYAIDVIDAYFYDADTEEGGQMVAVAQLLTFVHQHGYPLVRRNIDLWASILSRCRGWQMLPDLLPHLAGLIADVCSQLDY